MANRIYDNQPSLARVKERLKKDGWNAQRIADAQFHTFIQNRTSGNGNTYSVSVLVVFEDKIPGAPWYAVLAFSVSRNNRMFKEDNPIGATAKQDTFAQTEEERLQGTTSTPQKPQQSHEETRKRSLLNDLVNAQTDGLDGYPQTWDALEYFRRDQDGKRYPSILGAEFLVESGVPILWNPTNVDGWTQTKQDKLALTKVRNERLARQVTADKAIAAAEQLLAKSEISQAHRDQVEVDAGIYVASGEWPKRFDNLEGIDGTIIPQEESDVPVQNPDLDAEKYDNKPTKISDLPEQEDSEAEGQGGDDESLALLAGEKPQTGEEAAWIAVVTSSDGNGHDFGILEDLDDVDVAFAKRFAEQGLITIHGTELVNGVDPATQFSLTDDGFRKAGLEQFIETAPEPVQTARKGISVTD